MGLLGKMIGRRVRITFESKKTQQLVHIVPPGPSIKNISPTIFKIKMKPVFKKQRKRRGLFAKYKKGEN